MDYNLQMVRFFAGQASEKECERGNEPKEKCEPPAWSKIDPVARPESSALKESDPNKKEPDPKCPGETPASGSAPCKAEN
jgi:hypothetical protein